MTHTTWQERAACLGTDLGVWFTPDGYRGRHRGEREALAICASCPVLDRCREWVMAVERGSPHRFGIIAGLTPVQRVRLSASERRRTKNP